MISTAASNKSKTLFTLDSPYTQVKWQAHYEFRSQIRTNRVPRPAISLEDQTTILDMLCG